MSGLRRWQKAQANNTIEGYLHVGRLHEWCSRRQSTRLAYRLCDEQQRTINVCGHVHIMHAQLGKAHSSHHTHTWAIYSDGTLHGVLVHVLTSVSTTMNSPSIATIPTISLMMAAISHNTSTSPGSSHFTNQTKHGTTWQLVFGFGVCYVVSRTWNPDPNTRMQHK